MITAVIDHDQNTLIVQLPGSIMDLRLKLVSIGIRTPPDQIPLYATDDRQTKVQLFGETDVGKHLCQLLSNKNTLADANIAAYLTANADPAIKGTVEQRITGGQYKSVEELTADIMALTQSAGPVKKEFFFPLTGNIDEGDGNPYTVGDSFLYDYRYDIAEAIAKHQARDIENIASFYNDEDGVREKLVSADWATEVVDGTLYKTADDQLFLATGGFGCSPNSRGRKVFGEFLKDGEKTYYFRSDILGILKSEYLPQWAFEKLNPDTVMDAPYEPAPAAPSMSGM